MKGKYSFKYKIFKSETYQRLKKLIQDIIYYISDYLLIFYAIFFNLIFKKTLYKKGLKIITAVDFKFYESVKQLLENISNFSKVDELIIYDLGMTKEQNESIKKNFNFVTLKKFDFSKYPKFISEVDEFGKLGKYAWKSIILKNEIQDTTNLVFWFDSGNMIKNNLTLLKIVTTCFGLFTPYSNKKIKDWTHQSTIHLFSLDEKIISKRNRTGGIVCIDPNNIEAQNLVSDWEKYSLIKEYISPEGSNRENHRQDQSLLSILVNLNKSFKFSPRSKKTFGLKVNQNPNKNLYITDCYNAKDRLFIKKKWIKNNLYITNTVSQAKIIWILHYLDINRIKKNYLNSCNLIITIFDEDNLDPNDFKIISKRLRKNKEIIFLISKNSGNNLDILKIFPTSKINYFLNIDDLNKKIDNLIQL